MFYVVKWAGERPFRSRRTALPRKADLIRVVRFNLSVGELGNYRMLSRAVAWAIVLDTPRVLSTLLNRWF